MDTTRQSDWDAARAFFESLALLIPQGHVELAAYGRMTKRAHAQAAAMLRAVERALRRLILEAASRLAATLAPARISAPRARVRVQDDRFNLWDPRTWGRTHLRLFAPQPGRRRIRTRKPPDPMAPVEPRDNASSPPAQSAAQGAAQGAAKAAADARFLHAGPARPRPKPDDEAASPIFGPMHRRMPSLRPQPRGLYERYYLAKDPAERHALGLAILQARTQPTLGLARRIEAVTRLFADAQPAIRRAARALQRLKARLSNVPRLLRLDAWRPSALAEPLGALLDRLDEAAHAALVLFFGPRADSS